MRTIPKGKDHLYQAIFRHIERHIGPIGAVFEHPGQGLIHLDIVWVPPVPWRNHHTLITAGMSSRPMAPPEESGDCRFAELFLCLPPGWPISLRAFQEERRRWPLRELGDLALLPHRNESWLWEKHTVRDSGKARSFGPGTEFSAWIVGPHLPRGRDACPLKVDAEREVHFLSAMPLYKEEVDLAVHMGSDALFAKLDRAGVNEVINVRRSNVALRRRT